MMLPNCIRVSWNGITLWLIAEMTWFRVVNIPTCIWI